MPQPDLNNVQEARSKLLNLLHDEPSVSAVGIVRDGDSYAIKVRLTRLGAIVPMSIDGFRIDTEVIGQIERY